MKECLLYKKLERDKVQCKTCSHYCIIPKGQRGICGVRENKDGKLYCLNYGKIVALNIDPIEKKPLFHFLPGTQTLSIATVGCNFRCANCQNFDISQMPKENGRIVGKDFSPKEIVKLAQRNKTPSISYTYTEPTIFLEFALDVMKLAKQKGIKNIWVSNGFMSKETLEKISPYLDAANIDLKSFSENFYQKYCGGKLKPVLDNLIRLRKNNIWIEVTTLIIPTLSDSTENLKQIALFIKEKLGEWTPWHVTRFSGAISWKLQDIKDTPIETLKKAYEIGKQLRLKYVYTGNIPGLPTEDTFCPKCNALVIDRTGYVIHRHDHNGKCPKCGQDLDLILK
ncbi:AmmeMemoRadiSam system radical SAM enzyme [bacterium]|nr:AmmeMemoRadiSam system radical SAM enzyme [bacterium]